MDIKNTIKDQWITRCPEKLKASLAAERSAREGGPTVVRKMRLDKAFQHERTREKTRPSDPEFQIQSGILGHRVNLYFKSCKVNTITCDLIMRED